MSKILIIMAAGLGARYGGDKQIAGVGPSGEILLEYSVYDAIQSGFDKIIIIIKDGMESVLGPLLDRMKSAHKEVDFCFAYQNAKMPFDGIPIPDKRTKPLGTVHAVLSARELINSDFAVINADDYYGRSAYEILSCSMDKFGADNNAALVSYSLHKTLSKHGSVTRGICEIENGCLKRIRESYKVAINKDGGIYETTESGFSPLSPNTPVSMNMWAFKRETLPYMEEYLRVFLRGLHADDNKSECLLPIMAGYLMDSGVLKIAAYQTEEHWFGITYKEDAADASWELDKMHEDGHYPKKLF